MRTARAAFMGEEAGDPLPLEDFLCVIKGGTRKAESLGSLLHRPSLDANPM